MTGEGRVFGSSLTLRLPDCVKLAQGDRSFYVMVSWLVPPWRRPLLHSLPFNVAAHAWILIFRNSAGSNSKNRVF